MRSAGFRISPVKPAARRRRRSRLSVIGSPPLPLLTPYGSRLRAGIFLEVWKTLARLSARRRPASYGRGITLSRARQNEVRAPQPEGGTNDERHRSRRQGRVGRLKQGGGTWEDWKAVGHALLKVAQ